MSESIIYTFYAGIDGNPIEIDPRIQSMGEFHVGDTLQVKYLDLFRPEIQNATQLVVVGFIKNDMAIQIDDDRVFLISYNVAHGLFPYPIHG